MLSSVVYAQDAEPARFRPRHTDDRDRSIRAVLLVASKQQIIIHFINMIAGNDKNVFRVITFNKSHILINRVRRPLIPRAALLTYIRGQNMHAAFSAVKSPWCANSKMLRKNERLILRKHPYRFDAGMGTVAKRKVDYSVFPTER